MKTPLALQAALAGIVLACACRASAELPTAFRPIVVAGRSAGVPTVVLLAGRDASTAAVMAEIRRYRRIERRQRPVRLVALPLANPDGETLPFPPAGAAYRDNGRAHALWRWLGLQAPDLALVAGRSAATERPARALPAEAVAGVGVIPVRRLPLRVHLPAALPKRIAASAARRELLRRQALPPLQVAQALSRVYGQDFAELSYIPAVALIGRLRLGQQAEVAALLRGYLEPGRAEARNSVGLAAQLVFAELVRRGGDRAYLASLFRAADLGFGADGQPRDSLPFHEEMSDGVFMGLPLLAQAGALSGEARYLELALRHFEHLERLDLRPDGLYRHSPLADVAWGRGNGFPALGLALALQVFPPEHVGYARLLAAYRDLMAALARHQGEDGMWRQVIDRPDSYAEFSATAMIATAMAMGLRQGWLDGAVYRQRVRRAWLAVAARIDAQGRLLDVCESTGKQATLEAYLAREAIFGRDARGGAMALLFATEMAGLE